MDGGSCPAPTGHGRLEALPVPASGYASVVEPRLKAATAIRRRGDRGRASDRGDGNLGPDLALASVPEPLLAPPAGCLWHVRLSTEDPGYGGGGTPPVEDERGRWRLPGHTAVVLSPRIVPRSEGDAR